MPELRDNRKDRHSKLKEYFRRNCRTTAQVVDFIGGLQHAVSVNYEYATAEEILEWENLLEEYMMPMKKEAEGGLDTPDAEKMERRMNEFADYAIQLQGEIAREFKNQLSLVPEKIDNVEPENISSVRNKIAMYKTRNSEAYFKYNMAVNGILDILGRSDNANGYVKKFSDILASKNRLYLETLSETGKEYHIKAMDAVLKVPELLKDDDPMSVGLTSYQLEEEGKKIKNDLVERTDFNWASDKTMRAVPKYISEQLSSDENRRYGRYYMTLDEDGKKKFILDGMLGKAQPGIFQEKKVSTGIGKPEETVYKPVNVDCLSKKEKDIFRRACNVYFSPVKENGTPDKKLFVKRVDDILEEIANLKVRHKEFIQNEDNFKGILGDTGNLYKREKAAEYISPYYKKMAAYQLEMKDILDRKEINADLKKHYMKQKNGIEPEYMQDEVLNEEIWNTFAAEIENKTDQILRDKNIKVEINKMGMDKELFKDELAKAKKKFNSVSIGILEEQRSNKPWLNASKDISMDSLRRMNNLYEQFKNEDSMFYINSDEYTDLKNSLKAAADMYKAVNDVNRSKHEMSSEEKIRMESAFDAISDAALKYIDGKEKKARQTDHGQNRYEIAFAALGMTSKGAFNEMIEAHNIKHIFRASKTLSLQDLMERGDRTVEQQKAHEKIHKPREKRQEKRRSL